MEHTAERLWGAWRGMRLEHFTFVMATGIVATGVRNSGADLLSWILFWVASAGYAVLVTGTLAGLAAGQWGLRREFSERACRTMAFVAAGGVLSAYAAGRGWTVFALVLIVVSGVAWIAMQYAVVGALVVRAGASRRPRDLTVFDGTWFLLVVSTQAMAVSLGAWSRAADCDLGATAAVLFWGLGVLQLVIVACLVADRLLRAGIKAGEEVSPYWVFLGSGAISILAAAEVLGTREEQIVMPQAVVGGVAMALWAFVTWMIPLTVALQLWQAGRPGAIRGYRAALWAMVFPIGMYGESTRQLGFIRGDRWLTEVGRWESWIAFGVWTVVALGLVLAVVRIAAERPARRPSPIRW